MLWLVSEKAYRGFVVELYSCFLHGVFHSPYSRALERNRLGATSRARECSRWDTLRSCLHAHPAYGAHTRHGGPRECTAKIMHRLHFPPLPLVARERLSPVRSFVRSFARRGNASVSLDSFQIHPPSNGTELLLSKCHRVASRRFFTTPTVATTQHGTRTEHATMKTLTMTLLSCCRVLVFDVDICVANIFLISKTKDLSLPSTARLVTSFLFCLKLLFSRNVCSSVSRRNLQMVNGT